MQWDLPHRQQLCCGSLTLLSSWGPSPCQEGPYLLFRSLLGLSVWSHSRLCEAGRRLLVLPLCLSSFYPAHRHCLPERCFACGKQRSGACRGGELGAFCPRVFPGLVVKGLG